MSGILDKVAMCIGMAEADMTRDIRHVLSESALDRAAVAAIGAVREFGSEARLRSALQALFDDYKGLADSGDAGNWRLEDTDIGKATLLILNEPPCPDAPGGVGSGHE